MDDERYVEPFRRSFCACIFAIWFGNADLKAYSFSFLFYTNRTMSMDAKKKPFLNSSLKMCSILCVCVCVENELIIYHNLAYILYKIQSDSLNWNSKRRSTQLKSAVNWMNEKRSFFLQTSDFHAEISAFCWENCRLFWTIRGNVLLFLHRHSLNKIEKKTQTVYI